MLNIGTMRNAKNFTVRYVIGQTEPQQKDSVNRHPVDSTGRATEFDRQTGHPQMGPLRYATGR